MKTAGIGLLAAVAAFAQPNDKFQKLEGIFTDYELLQLDPKNVDRQVKVYREPLVIEIAGEQLVFEMELRDLRSHRYRAESTGNDGLRQTLPPDDIDTFKGTAVGAPHVQGRFTITEEHFDGVVFTPDDWLYIEPVENYLPDADPADMVAYRKSDIAHDERLKCGASSLHHFEEQSAFKIEIPAPKSTDYTTEYTVEVATEADYEYTRSSSGVSGANRKILGILNRIEGVYEVATAQPKPLPWLRWRNRAGKGCQVKSKSKEPVVRNPRYKGATAGLVARALLRQRKGSASPQAAPKEPARKVNPGI